MLLVYCVEIFPIFSCSDGANTERRRDYVSRQISVDAKCRNGYVMFAKMVIWAIQDGSYLYRPIFCSANKTYYNQYKRNILLMIGFLINQKPAAGIDRISIIVFSCVMKNLRWLNSLSKLLVLLLTKPLNMKCYRETFLGGAVQCKLM